MLQGRLLVSVTGASMLGKAKQSAESSLDVSVFDAVILAETIADRCQLAVELGRLTCNADTAAADRRAVVPGPGADRHPCPRGEP